MPLEHAGSIDRSAEQAADRASVHAKTQSELNNLGQAVEANEQAETPAERTARLGVFVETFFAEVCPPNHRSAAVAECIGYEDDCRELFEEPGLCLAEEDAEDPELGQKIEAAALEKVAELAETETAVANNAGQLRQEEAAANELASATKTAPEASINLVKTDQEVGQKIQDIKTAVAKKSETNQQRSAEVQNLKQAQARFDELKAQHGGDTIAALRSLLASDQLQSSEIRDYLQNTIATAEALRTALPGKENVVTQLLNASSLDLSAGGGAATFADFLTAVDASEELTEVDKSKLREVLHGPAEIKTGSDIKAAFAEGRGIVTKPDGTTESIAYDEAHPVELAAGISVYPDGRLIRGTAKIAGRSFPFRASANISGSALTEQLNCYAALAIKESAGLTGGTKQGFEATQGTKELDLSGELFETQAVRFGKLTCENLIDGFDASSRLITEAQVRQMQWGFQWLMPQRDALGDGGYGDNNEATRTAALGGGGHDGLIWDGNDNLNEDNYRLACQFIRDQGRTGASEPDFGALVAYLEDANGMAEAA